MLLIGPIVLIALNWCWYVDAGETVFPIHPYTDKILKDLRVQGKIHGARWYNALAKLTTVCHPMDANGLAHIALALVNLKQEFVASPVIKCDPNKDISSCAALDQLSNAGLTDLAEFFVKLHAICTAVAHPQRSGASDKTVDLVSDLNGAIVSELSQLEASLRQQTEAANAKDDPNATSTSNDIDPSNKSLLASAMSLTGMFSLVSTLAKDASKAIQEVIDKGCHYLCISHILITYVTFLLASYWLTTRFFCGVRQACFLIAFSNCIVHIWLLHKSYSGTGGRPDIAWLSPNLTDSTILHCVLLIPVLVFKAIRGQDVRIKHLDHIGRQHTLIREIVQNLAQAGRLRPAQGVNAM